MKDEYVSVEHIMIAIFDNANREIKDIFKKYNINGVFEKDFSKKEIYYTDSLVMGCYYSMYSPLYFYNFLLDNNYFKSEFREDEYLKNGLLNYTKNLKRFMKFNGFSESDKNTVLSIVCDEWRFINSRSNNINLLFVRRSSISNNSNNINDYYDENGNVFELVDKMLCCKKNSISSSTCLYNNYGIINFSDCFVSNLGNLDISNFLLVLATIFSIISGAEYYLMNKDIIFENIKHIDEFDIEYWLARELKKVLEYT